MSKEVASTLEESIEANTEAVNAQTAEMARIATALERLAACVSVRMTDDDVFNVRQG